MLRQKMLWLRESEKLPVEIRQCRDEGRDIAPLMEAAEQILNMDEGVEKEKAAKRMMLQLEKSPIRADYPYVEPETLEEIHAVLPETASRCYAVAEEEKQREKLTGAWTGRACGCLLGIPVESWYRQRIHDYLTESGQYPLKGYISSQTRPEIRKKFGVEDRDIDTPYDRQMKCWINNMDELPVDDDMNYTVLSLRVLESCGRDFTAEDVAEAWLYAVPALHTCTAERVAYRNLMHCILPPESGKYLNPYREWIGAQIRVDFYGYINPGNPAAAAAMAYRDAIVAQTKNGVYAAMYIAALIALLGSDCGYEEAAEEALNQIPPESRLSEAVRMLLREYRSGVSLQVMIDQIHQKYNEKDAFDWCLAIPNVLVILAVLLHCKSDYSEAICQATLAGFDTDCNAATVGSMIGYREGIACIEEKWTAPIRQVFHSSVYRYEQATIPELVARTLKFIPTVSA